MTDQTPETPPINRRAGHRPEWLKIRIPGNLDQLPVSNLMKDLALNTVCQEARCPNIFECWAAGTATFMILGEICTRRCTFCAVGKGKPLLADAGEPARVAEAVERMGVKHCVITMVNRDDLPDGGAEQVAQTVRAVRERTGAAVEVLISDLEGNREALRIVIESKPEVLAHNVETVPRLYSAVRPVAKYERSLDLLRWAHEEGMLTKSSIMLGLGEREEEILQTASHLRAAGVDIFTMGQYLAPTGNHHPVRRYYTPEEFAQLGDRARALGFHHVESAPLVRSSYMAHRAVQSAPHHAARDIRR
ncbi:MAG TPA: lipoyl synthase [Thermoanaerobaculia bacterium]|jgi:lipoic acid synthetase|nr:lipoyl synthase [Thermoanaerobaculia bacterium]